MKNLGVVGHGGKILATNGACQHQYVLIRMALDFIAKDGNVLAKPAVTTTHACAKCGDVRMS